MAAFLFQQRSDQPRRMGYDYDLRAPRSLRDETGQRRKQVGMKAGLGSSRTITAGGLAVRSAAIQRR